MADPELYRHREEVETWKLRDRCGTSRPACSWVGFHGEQAEAISAEVDRIIEEAVEFANQSPDPDESALFEDVYIEPAASEIKEPELVASRR